MTYRVEITTSALRELKKLPKDLRTALLQRMAALADDPHSSGAEKVVDVEHAYRIRVGDYRIAYLVLKGKTVLVAKVGHRSEVYKHVVAVLKKAASKRKPYPE